VQATWDLVMIPIVCEKAFPGRQTSSDTYPKFKEFGNRDTGSVHEDVQITPRHQLQGVAADNRDRSILVEQMAKPFHIEYFVSFRPQLMIGCQQCLFAFDLRFVHRTPHPRYRIRTDVTRPADVHRPWIWENGSSGVSEESDPPGGDHDCLRPVRTAKRMLSEG